MKYELILPEGAQTVISVSVNGNEINNYKVEGDKIAFDFELCIPNNGAKDKFVEWLQKYISLPSTQGDDENPCVVVVYAESDDEKPNLSIYSLNSKEPEYTARTKSGKWRYE